MLMGGGGAERFGGGGGTSPPLPTPLATGLVFSKAVWAKFIQCVLYLSNMVGYSTGLTYVFLGPI